MHPKYVLSATTLFTNTILVPWCSNFAPGTTELAQITLSQSCCFLHTSWVCVQNIDILYRYVASIYKHLECKSSSRQSEMVSRTTNMVKIAQLNSCFRNLPCYFIYYSVKQFMKWCFSFSVQKMHCVYTVQYTCIYNHTRLIKTQKLNQVTNDCNKGKNNQANDTCIVMIVVNDNWLHYVKLNGFIIQILCVLLMTHLFPDIALDISSLALHLRTIKSYKAHHHQRMYCLLYRHIDKHILYYAYATKTLAKCTIAIAIFY